MASKILVTVLFAMAMSLFVLSMGVDSPVACQTIGDRPQVQVDATSNGPLDGYGNLTALGILGGMSLFIVCKMLPSLHRQFMEQAMQFAEQLSAQNRTFAESMAKQSQTFAETISRANDAIADNTRAVGDLRTHCAEVQAKRG